MFKQPDARAAMDCRDIEGDDSKFVISIVDQVFDYRGLFQIIEAGISLIPGDTRMIIISVIIAKPALGKDRINLPAAFAAKNLIIQDDMLVLAVIAAVVTKCQFLRFVL